MAANFDPIWVAGFMSGTSLDAVDAAMILTDGERVFDFGPAVERKYTDQERLTLERATDSARRWNWTGDPPDTPFEKATETVLQTHIETYARLLENARSSPIANGSEGMPDLIGVHGQTVLHRPPTDTQIGATLQLMDGAQLAAKLKMPVAYDFRTADVATGGQGAPLAPAYHRALLQRLGDEPAAVLNLGGVANITARMSDGALIAFDTGPANGPIDEWVSGHDRGLHDENGLFAERGLVHEGLLAQLFEHPFFSMRPPKSLDRYDFNASMARGLNFYDGCATLTAFSARAVATGLQRLPEAPARVIACGGGRHNPSLMRMLSEAVPCPVVTAEAVGWRGDSIEAEAFAFLAVRTLRGLPLSWPETTGVPTAQTGGQISTPEAPV
ncbi:MAG: anhydro-N-acetylmuramic acid kinase [Pseudomonadota bacterium]